MGFFCVFVHFSFKYIQFVHFYTNDLTKGHSFVVGKNHILWEYRAGIYLLIILFTVLLILKLIYNNQLIIK